MRDLLLTTLENSRAYTLAVAEAMPENFYDFKPTENSLELQGIVTPHCNTALNGGMRTTSRR